jgi:hypothetical protein
VKEISEVNVYVKFEKSLGMPQSHPSNLTPSKVQRAKPPPSIFAISHLQMSSTMVLSCTVTRRKMAIYVGHF